jgi:aryl-alcohol dehydrogenase-like predicted oxidoreductase
VGATKQNHLEEAVAALGIKLTTEETASLEEAYIPHPVLGFS